MNNKKITKKDIKPEDVREFQSIYQQLHNHWVRIYLTNEEVIGFFMAKAKWLTLDKIRWFFTEDSNRTFNHEKI